MDYINKNTLKIIEALCEKELYFNEIYEKTKIKSKNNLLKNLNYLFKEGILNKKVTRSNTYYSLNYKNQITISLLDLINKEKFERFSFNVKKTILELIKECTPRIAIVFGSYAKENVKEKKDIDLLFVDGKKDEEKIKEISEIYGTKPSLIFISFEEFEKPNESLLHIIKTGFPLVGGEYFYERSWL